MTYFISRMQATITFLLIASIGQTYGYYENLPGYGESEDYCSCQPECCGKGFISAELLYWRTFETGLDRCIPVEISDTITSDGQVISRFRGKARDPHFKWNPGFRIGAGYEFACSRWDVDASWSHLHAHSHSFNSNEIDGRWNIDLDVFDIMAGYEADLGSCFSLRPFAGLRSARINQKIHIREFSNIFTENELITLNESNKENFWGVGPLIGLQAGWDMGCGFSLYASASLSLLYGRFDVHLFQTDKSIDSLDQCKLGKHLDASINVADVALGIQWKTCYCDKWLVFQLGLEHHRYFDYNRFCEGDLSFDGVNFSAGIEF